MTSPRVPLLAVALLGAAGGASRAHAAETAAPPPARLEWQQMPGAESCIDADRLRAAINERWRRTVIEDPHSAAPGEPRRLTLRGRSEHRAGRFFVRLDLSNDAGESLGSRELSTRARHCSALDDSVALAAGLMLDFSLEDILDAQRGAVPDVAPVPRSVPKVIHIPDDTAAPRQPWTLEMSGGLTGDVGLLPGLALGAGAHLSVRAPRGPLLGAGFVAWLPDESSRAGAGLEMAAWAAELSACFVPLEREPLRLSTCVEQRLGRARARGLELERPRDTAEPFATLGVSTGISVLVSGPLFVGVRARLDAALLRYRFGYDDSRGNRVLLHEMSPVSGGLLVEGGARF